MNLSTNKATPVFEAHCQVSHERTAKLKNYKHLNLVESSNDYQDLESPIFHPFLNASGNESVQNMINFVENEMEETFDGLKKYMDREWNHGNGNRCKMFLFDSFFITLTLL